MGQATKDQQRGKDRASTREKVIEATLRLFNEKGPGRVTTAEIAATVEINEGNLYYHFRTKEALIGGLFARFEEAAATFVAGANAAAFNEPAAYPQFLRAWFALVWDYRFLFRDLIDLLAIAPSLAEKIQAVSQRMGFVLEAILGRMESEGLIAVPVEDRQPLLANVWIVATYWAVYLNLQQRVPELNEDHLDWGINQVSVLFRPYLSPLARQAFEQPPSPSGTKAG